MLVTDISPTKRGRYSVFVEGEFCGVLHADVYLTSSIQVGQEISSDNLSHLLLESQKLLAKERAFKLLGARSYTAKGLYDKLIAREIDEEIAEATVLRMQELGFIDDEDYARRYGSDCLKLRFYSPYKTVQELKRKGIDGDLAARVVEDLADDSNEDAISTLVCRKYLPYLEEEKGRSKTINALMRKGYRYEEISIVIRNLREDPDYYVALEG